MEIEFSVRIVFSSPAEATNPKYETKFTSYDTT